MGQLLLSAWLSHTQHHRQQQQQKHLNNPPSSFTLFSFYTSAPSWPAKIPAGDSSAWRWGVDTDFRESRRCWWFLQVAGPLFFVCCCCCCRCWGTVLFFNLRWISLRPNLAIPCPCLRKGLLGAGFLASACPDTESYWSGKQDTKAAGGPSCELAHFKDFHYCAKNITYHSENKIIFKFNHNPYKTPGGPLGLIKV